MRKKKATKTETKVEETPKTGEMKFGHETTHKFGAEQKSKYGMEKE